MEQKFQASFIPKKPLASSMGVGSQVFAKPKRQISIFFIIAVTLFLLSLASVGAAYAWKNYQISQKETYITQLKDRQKQFDMNAIGKFKDISVQMSLAEQLLQKHVAVSQIFPIIQNLTSENVRFVSMDLSMPKENGNVQLTMKGIGKNLPSVAFQSYVFSHLENYNLRDFVKNPILTDPALDSSTDVSFGFSATIDPKMLLYSRALGGSTSTSTDSVTNQ